MFLWVLYKEGEAGRPQLLIFSIAVVLCPLAKGGVVYGWECVWWLLPSKTHLTDISSNSVFSHFTQHFLSVSKQTNNNSNFLHLGKKSQTEKRRHSFLPLPPSVVTASLVCCRRIAGALLAVQLWFSSFLSFSWLFYFSEKTVDYFENSICWAIFCVPPLSETLLKSIELFQVTPSLNLA